MIGPNEIINVGLIGSGFVAELHAEAFRLVKGANIIAVASPTEDRRAKFVKKFKIPNSFSDYQQLLEMKDIDVVCVAVPNNLHAKVTVDAAEAKKHVIVEKPLCTTLSEADQMIEVCRKNDVKLCYAETLVFTPKYVKMKELIDDGALGKVYYVKQAERHFGPHSDWFWDISQAGGGFMMDAGCHGIEFCRWILNKQPIKSVYAHCETIFHHDKGLGEDTSLLIIEFQDGAIGLVENSSVRRGGMDDRSEAFGIDGNIEANLLMGNALKVYSEFGYTAYAGEKIPTTKGWTWVYWDEILQYGFHEEMIHFIDCIRNDKQPKETGEDGRVVLEVLYAGYESAAKGQKINFPYKPERPDLIPITPWLKAKGKI